MEDLMKPFLKDGKSLLIAYDQGLEHGPSADFDDRNVNPQFIMDIAEEGNFSGVVFQKGCAEKYYKESSGIPLIVKVNGKANLTKGDVISRQVCSVKKAISIGAKGIGYTIYAGSSYESEMFQEFGRIQEEAHDHGLPAISWIYPRGGKIPDLGGDSTKETVAYAARIGLELGADAVKIKYPGNSEDFKWAVQSAGKAHVFMSGGPKTNTDEDFLKLVTGVMDAGATGVAVGRNVWQHQDPLNITAKIKEIIFEGKRVG
tara:strand:- start:4116 stop:4892 length:777 start_codon:yes stop_codon:yes gene_type:complete